MVDLEKNVKYIKGVGPAKQELLNKLRIYTLNDLITNYPRTYEDRSKKKSLIECSDGEVCLIEAVVLGNILEVKTRGKTMYKLQVDDGTAKATVIWFNQKYLKNLFKVGEKFRFYGKISVMFGNYTITSPIFENSSTNTNSSTGKIVPIYSLTYNLSQNIMRKIMESAVLEIYGNLEETLPKYIIDRFNLVEINNAIKKIHFPDNFSEFELARRRLVFEELLIMQLALLKLKSTNLVDESGIKFDKNVKIDDFINILPFKLTNAQLRSARQIDLNMEKNEPMNRLLQGDVGSRQDCYINDFSI